MLYQIYLAQSDAMAPIRALASLLGETMTTAFLPETGLSRAVSAACEMMARASPSHCRPSFGIFSASVGNRTVGVHEEQTLQTPFATLLHFKKDIDSAQPRVLVVAPLSGHFATLLRNCVRTLLPEHDVYVTDWHNARDVSLADGEFGFDDYVDHIISFLEAIGEGVHVVAVCQPCVQALVASAIMAQDDNPAEPASLTLMAGPIDTRVNPTKVNELAKSKSMDWFANNLIATVPARYAGRGRRVYPGFLQLASFMSMNLDRHVKSHLEWFEDLSAGRTDRANVKRDFYDEYGAVLDLPAPFYLETVRSVFQEHSLVLGELEWRGRRIDPRAIRRSALLTVEGERDDICAVGQTVAAQDLCKNIKPYKKRHHLQAGIGHYGVFSGRRWETQIYPILRNFILANER
jgi:poly(3-hydroxybutyrate) depolymerase